MLNLDVVFQGLTKLACLDTRYGFIDQCVLNAPWQERVHRRVPKVLGGLKIIKHYRI
jgi:hypothetical protein